jgi:shikimate kinase
MLELLTERTPVYESVARMRVSTTGRTVQQVVDAILAGLGESND